eukprot:6325151-Amphidinium_carterae.3
MGANAAIAWACSVLRRLDEASLSCRDTLHIEPWATSQHTCSAVTGDTGHCLERSEHRRRPPDPREGRCL